jgi:YidC/Oxa1 family membrane protein insertase
MQQLNPKMQAVRAKYAGKLKDKQGRPNFEMQRKMNEETMALYKAEGVNPMGGCLPIVLQLPVFIAFYNILYTMVELRHAPWILWIKDLSALDPYYVLPIIMGATQLAQQLMMPPMGNPAQRKMMLLMPLVFTYFFVNFPSGLVLYWLTNNVLSIIQQAVYNQLKKRKAQQASAKPGTMKAV